MNEKLISPEDRKTLEEEFKGFKNDVQVLIVKGPDQNEFTDFTINFTGELAELNDKIKVEVISADHEIAKKENIDSFPYVFIGYDKGYHIEFMGATLGYEARSVIEDIKMVATGNSSLSDNAKNKIKELLKPASVHVFVTPTCPYCPGSVIMAHALAYENKMIKSVCVEATENPEISNKFQVSSVPKQIINLNINKQSVGVQPEMKLVSEILQS